MARRSAVLAAASLAAACHVEVPEPIYSACEALASSDWSAEIVNGPHFEGWDRKAPTLVVTGTVTVPSPGYRLYIEPGPVIDLKPPVKQVILRTEPPEGEARGPTTAIRVSGSMGWHGEPETVSVRCGDGIVAEIDKIYDRRETGPAI